MTALDAQTFNRQAGVVIFLFLIAIVLLVLVEVTLLLINGIKMTWGSCA